MTTFARDPKYLAISFDAEELHVIRQACEAVAVRHQARLDEATKGDLETYVHHAGMANTSMLIGQLVAFFKPGQEILIEPEDLAPVARTLEEHRVDVEEERADALERALTRIRVAIRRDSDSSTGSAA